MAGFGSRRADGRTDGDVTRFPFVALLFFFFFLALLAASWLWPISFLQAKHVVKFVVWWVGLGTVSSVGLGCGFQTGVLFLFPHIMKVRRR